MAYKFIQVSKIKEMLFNKPKYIAEFCEAGILSITEFNANFSRHLQDRNLEKLRAAGHKIKPGAQMMGANEVVREYEKAKKLLQNEAGEHELQAAVNSMNEICTAIQQELKTFAKELQ